MFAAMKCLVGRHEPDRQRIWNDGIDFRSSCIGCGREMLRDFQQGWRLFDSATDVDARRTVRQGH